MSVSKRRRFEVFKRDKFTCQYCGNRPPDVTLEVDHIVPRAEGGSDALANLTTACFSCNRGKSAVPHDNVAFALDELEQLAAFQEMLERKRDLEAQLALTKKQEALEWQAAKAVTEWWDDVFPPYDDDDPTHIVIGPVQP